jgi:polyferredoxin
MSELGHETLIDYSSLAGSQGKQPRRLRPRTVIYGGMLTGIAAAFVVLVSGRIPFEASVNRSPGTLYTLDADGFVRNTYLLNITNNYPGDTTVSYSVSVEGLEGAQVHLPVIQMAPEETRTLPLVVRILATDQLERTIPVQVRIATRVSERLLGTTFKTGAHVGSTP